MSDLETLIRNRQDMIRGRPLTPFESWREQWWPIAIDWQAICLGMIMAACVAMMLATTAMLWLALLAVVPAHGRDAGQWETTSDEVRAWYRELKQPDNSRASCCGEADAYYADKVYRKDGKNIAVITDERDDAPLGRPHVPVGTEIVIPNWKMKWDRGNPTGHKIIFLTNPADDGHRDVYCFIDDGGV